MKENTLKRIRAMRLHRAKDDKELGLTANIYRQNYGFLECNDSDYKDNSKGGNLLCCSQERV